MRMFSKGLLITMACATFGLGAANSYALGLKQWNPITINGYMDNTRCLKDWNAPCGSYTITREAEVYSGIPGALGQVTFKDWEKSYFQLVNVPFMSQDGDLDLAHTGYKFKLSGKVTITHVYRTNGAGTVYSWYPCGGNGSQYWMTLTEAAQGKKISCHNTDVESWFMGYKVFLEMKVDLFRTEPTPPPVRQLTVPKVDLVFVLQGKNQYGFDGTMRFDDVFIDGGTIRLNDRKCFINLAELKVPFGQIESTGASQMRKEVPTEIPLFCSGFRETIGTDESVIRDINGAGIKNTINGISITAFKTAENNKQIALPERDDLFVEVGLDSQNMCNTGSTIAVDGNQKVGGSQDNGPVWDNPGRQEGRPVKLYWRLCQKDIKKPLKPGAFKEQPAAQIRIHYN